MSAPSASSTAQRVGTVLTSSTLVSFLTSWKVTYEAKKHDKAGYGKMCPEVSDQFYSALLDDYYDVYSDAFYDPGTP
jgi:hypothetical protein